MNKLTFLMLLPVVSTGAGRHYLYASHTDSDANPTSITGSASLRPVKWTVVGGNQTRQVMPGRALPIVVQAEIASGWHIYSLSQKAGGPIPLRLDLVGAADVIIRGLIEAPKPERTFDKNFGIETELYSGTPRFTIPVGVATRSLAGVRKLQVAARYQVCSDKLCLPPRTDKLDLTLRIVGRK
jgi:hypothetical protein